MVINCVLGLDIAEALSIVFQEGLSREEQLCVNRVVLNRDLGNVDRINIQGSLGIDLDIHLRGALFGLFEILASFVSNLSFSIENFILDLVHLFFVVKFSVELVKLICNCEEHHAPVRNGVLIILLNDLSRNIELSFLLCWRFLVTCESTHHISHLLNFFLIDEQINRAVSRKEVEVSCKVVVLDSECAMFSRLRNSLEKINSLGDSVLQLQVINKDHLVLS